MISAFGSQGIPGVAHFEAASRASDCSIYRSLLQRTEDELRIHEDSLENLEATLRDKRKILVECAGQMGLDTTADLNESQIAEVCPTRYTEWLDSGYRYHSLRSDVKTNRNWRKHFSGKVAKCEKLPIPPLMRELAEEHVEDIRPLEEEEDFSSPPLSRRGPRE